MGTGITLLIGILIGAAVAAIVTSMVASSKSKAREASAIASATDQVREQVTAAVREEEQAQAREQMEFVRESYEKQLSDQQQRFDQVMNNMKENLVSSVKDNVKAATEDMLKARQKELAEANNTNLGQIVNPLKENIAELKKAMDAGAKEQAERNGELRENIKNLMQHSDAARKSADELAAAFKHGSKIQGDWGETILEELLTAQGLTEGVHYDTQATIVDADGKVVKSDEGHIMRPDVILHLDERREVIIDSKVSLTSYVEYVNAETQEEKDRYLKLHIDSLRAHVKELAKKDYSRYVQAPKVSAGYVIMFVPNTGALWTVLNAEPGFWREAAEQNVYIADEQSLFAALKIVNLTWTQVVQNQNHEKVYALAQEMIERVGMFMDKYKAMGTALDKARSEYDDGIKKLSPEGQSIQNTAKKLIALGAKNSAKHPLALDE